MPFSLILILAVVVIGFNQTVYEVSENVGQALVYVVVRNGILRRPVVVNVFTADNTALGECSDSPHYNYILLWIHVFIQMVVTTLVWDQYH